MELPPDPATGTRRRLTAKGKTAAAAKLRLQGKREEFERTGKLRSAATPMLRDWLDRWLDDIIASRLRPTTVATYRSNIESSIKPAIGGVRIGSLEPRHFRSLEEYIVKGDEDTGRKPRSSATAGSVWRTLHKALDDAVHEGLIEANPADRAEPPRVAYKERRALSLDQAHLMIDSEPNPMWRLMWRIAFETGMRQAERHAMLSDEFVMDADGGIMLYRVRWELKLLKVGEKPPVGLGARHVSGRAWLWPPKTARGCRDIALSTSLAAELGEYMHSHPILHGLLFTQPNGDFLTPQIERRAWKAALERAGLSSDFVPHSARHTLATELSRQRVPEKVREAILGHTVAVSDGSYVHVSAADLMKAVEPVEAALSE